MLRFALAALIVAMLPLALPAQQLDTAKPLIPSFWWTPGWFMIGPTLSWDGIPLGDHWLHTHMYGGNTITADKPEHITALHKSSYRTDDDRMFISAARASNAFKAGFGREIQLYPFDSVQTPFYPSLFHYKSGGITDSNTSATFQNQLEQVYSSTNTSPGQLILSNPAYNYDSLQQIYPMKRSRFDDSARSESDFFEKTSNHWDFQNYCRSFWFVTTAHLFDPLNASASNDTAVLRIALWHDIPKDFKYLNNARQIITAGADTSILCDSFSITKGELLAGPSVRENYRIISHRSNLRTRAIDGGPGPFDPGQPQDMGSLNLDIKVYWTGAEKVALRSVAIRDTLGELCLGKIMVADTDMSERFRQSIIYDNWWRFYYAWNKDTNDLRKEIMRFEIGRESDWNETEFAGFEAMNKLIRDSINLGAWRAARGEAVQPGDSASAFQINYGKRRFHYLTSQDEVINEWAFNDPRDTVSHFAHLDSAFYPQAIYETPNHQIPTIKQHNGGRGHLPWLLDADSAGSQSLATLRPRIEDYETTLQRMWYGRADSARKAFYVYPYHLMPGLTGDLLEAARAGREHGRRLVPYIYTYSHVQLRHDDSSGLYDTLFSHKPEPGELRAQANIALCYGAYGVVWPAMTDHLDNMVLRVVGGDSLWVNEGTDQACCQGSSSVLYGGDTLNTVAAYTMRTADTPHIDRTIFPNFYVGYQNITGAIKDINTKWLKLIGPTMTTLRWRNSYSMHFTGRWPGLRRDTVFRGIPPGEIIKGATSRDMVTGVLDSAQRTFVEVGLFDRKNSTTDRKNDTNYLFVVNRRTFERPPEVPDTSGAGRKLDSLAESREIGITWNIPDPGADQYPFIRVREVLPDTARLPLAGSARTPLDTVVAIDGTTLMKLRPGGGALLEVTYVEFDSSNFKGELRFNSQRKLCFDGSRFHVTYNHRYYFNNWRNPMVHYDSTEGVFYRRSVPVTGSTGSVMWEPWEYMVNDTTGGYLRFTFDNVFPSMAIRLGKDSVTNTAGETIVTIVWSAHEIPLTGDDIYLRKIRSANSGVTLSPSTDTVGFASGADSTLWGTPVVSTLAGGDLVAWSSNGAGIIARLRKRSTWNVAGTYTSSDSISRWDPAGYGLDAHYPTMPASAHIRSADSNVGIAWQQNLGFIYAGGLPASLIRYARVTDSSYLKPGAPPKIVDTLKNQNYQVLSTESVAATHPSMDLWQDVFNQVYEGVAWNDNTMTIDHDVQTGIDNSGFTPWIHFRSLFTETRRGTTAHDSIEKTQLWGLAKLRVLDGTLLASPTYHYPNTSSLNQVYALTDMPDTSHHDSTYFSVAFYDSAHFAMRQATIEFAHTSFKAGFPREYSYGDLHPNGSSSPVRQEGRHNVVYQSEGPEGATRIRSTRQFFAKARPLGYVADGREIAIPLSATTPAGIAGMLHDVWYAGIDQAGPAAMTERGVTSVRIDSLPQARELMRTTFFHAHDSTTIGCELRGRYYGDSTLGNGARTDFIAELVDSTTGAAVAMLDSFRVTVAEPLHGRRIEKECDLLSGTYYVRMRVETSGVPDLTIKNDSRYPVAELASWVEAPRAGKLRRLDASSGGMGRIATMPNPIAGAAEVLFSVPERGMASVTLYDARGGEAMRVVERGMIDAGRYAVEIDGSTLPAGAYMLELRYGSRRLVEKIVVVR